MPHHTAAVLGATGAVGQRFAALPSGEQEAPQLGMRIETPSGSVFVSVVTVD